MATDNETATTDDLVPCNLESPVENSSDMSTPEALQPLLLLVDDDLGSLIMAEEALDEAGFRVLQAENGLEALEVCEKQIPDLIIMDVIMPKMNGFEACEKVRSTDWGEHIPILMVTGLEDIESINKAYEVGATDFLTKPINFFVLPHRVRYMLRSKDTADRLRSSQNLLDHAQRIAQLGHWEWDRVANQTRWSKGCANLLPLQEATSDNAVMALQNLIHVDDWDNVLHCFGSAVEESRQYHVEFRVVLSDSDDKVFRMQAEPQCDSQGECVTMLGTLQDITERHNTQQQIHDLAYYDHVTGLPNRALLYDRLTTTLGRSIRYSKMFAVLFLDLDRFKQVNDTLGHDAGDDLLTQVSQRLSACVRESDQVARTQSEEDPANRHTIARLGGDEFVVLLSQINKPDDAARAAKRIAKRIAESYEILGSVVNISTTIGISVYPADGDDAEKLLKNADIAMYHAKKKGCNRFQFYSEDIQRKAQERFEMEQALRKSIDDQDFRLVYQPKVSASTGNVCGVEALVRWDHPTAGPILPYEFITLAEETELIIPLGEWIMEAACKQTKIWQQMGFDNLQVAVNCSSIQLMKADIPKLLNCVLSRTNLDPKFLEIELTESLLLDDAERGIQILENLQAIGIMTAIDDFGTGFSSMSYLRRMPVSKLKIDQSFVREIGSNKSDEAIVSAILTLAKNLDLTVVAEGVETQAQLDFLIEHGCDEIQGYLISKPLEVDVFEQWLKDQPWQNQSLKKAG